MAVVSTFTLMLVGVAAAATHSAETDQTDAAVRLR